MFLEVTIKPLLGDPLTGNFVARERGIHVCLFHLNVNAKSSHCVDLRTSVSSGT